MFKSLSRGKYFISLKSPSFRTFNSEATSDVHESYLQSVDDPFTKVTVMGGSSAMYSLCQFDEYCVEDGLHWVTTCSV